MALGPHPLWSSERSPGLFRGRGCWGTFTGFAVRRHLRKSSSSDSHDYVCVIYVCVIPISVWQVMLCPAPRYLSCHNNRNNTSIKHRASSTQPWFTALFVWTWSNSFNGISLLSVKLKAYSARFRYKIHNFNSTINSFSILIHFLSFASLFAKMELHLVSILLYN